MHKGECNYNQVVIRKLCHLIMHSILELNRYTDIAVGICVDLLLFKNIHHWYYIFC